jgi:hypothetical protein
MTMAETEATQQDQQQEEQGGNGSDAKKTALRAAAIAAASGATAIAAKKAFSDRQQGGSSKQQNGGSPDSLFGGMLGSGLHAAKDSLIPFAEDAARAAGEYLGGSGPDIVRETIVPAFIEGFQGAQKSGD